MHRWTGIGNRCEVALYSFAVKRNWSLQADHVIATANRKKKQHKQKLNATQPLTRRAAQSPGEGVPIGV